MVLRGEGSLLLHWLDQLPARSCIAARNWSSPKPGPGSRMASWMRWKPCLRLLAAPPASGSRLLGEIAAIRAIVATVHQDIPAIQQQAALALQNLPADDSLVRAAMALSLGTAASALRAGALRPLTCSSRPSRPAGAATNPSSGWSPPPAWPGPTSRSASSARPPACTAR